MFLWANLWAYAQSQVSTSTQAYPGQETSAYINHLVLRLGSSVPLLCSYGGCSNAYYLGQSLLPALSMIPGTFWFLAHDLQRWRGNESLKLNTSYTPLFENVEQYPHPSGWEAGWWCVIGLPLNLKYCDEKTMKENFMYYFYSSFFGMDRRMNLEDGHWSLRQSAKNRIWLSLHPSSYFSDEWFSASAFAFGLSTAFALFPASSWCLEVGYTYFWLDSGITNEDMKTFRWQTWN